jgi:putative aminopeptidase FrvX
VSDGDVGAAPAAPAAADDGLATWIETTRRLLTVPSVVGDERPFLVHLERELAGLGVECSAYDDRLVATGDDPASATISVHVDRHGLMCTGPGEFEYAAFVTRRAGDVPPDSVSQEMISRVAARFEGEPVVAYQPWTGDVIGRGTIRSAYLVEAASPLRFEAEGLDHLAAGVPIAYGRPPESTATHLRGQLDNVLGVSLALELYRRGFGGTTVFTTQEECGRSWRFILEHFRRLGRRTDRLLVLDTSPFADEATAAQWDVVLRRADATAGFAEGITDEVAAAASGLGLKAIVKDAVIREENVQRVARGESPRSLGRTELGRLIEATDGTITGTTVQLPTSGYHTPRETVTRRSMAATIALLERVLQDRG